MIQDQENNYWIATNKGLYTYDYYEFTPVSCKDAKSDELFNFVQSAKGVIYAHNLNGQIFAIENGKCELYYELSADDMKPDITLIMDDEDNLVISISGSKIICVNQDKEIHHFKVTTNYYGLPFKMPDGSIIFHIGNTDSIIRYAHHQCTIDILQRSEQSEPEELFHFIHSDQGHKAVNLITHEVLEFDPFDLRLSRTASKELLLPNSEIIRVYQTNGNLWIAGTIPGVIFRGADQMVETTWYDDIYISDVYHDHEGNYLLSTFDRGILVIPDVSFPDVIDSFEDASIVSLYKGKDGLYLGSSVGYVYQYNNKEITVISNTGKRPIDGIYGSANKDWIVFDDGKIRFLNVKTGEVKISQPVSLKDGFFNHNNEAILGSNLGVYRVNLDTVHEIFDPKEFISTGVRVYSLAYDEARNEIYVAGSQGVKKIAADGSETVIQYQGEDLFVTYLTFYDDRLYCLKAGVGILIYHQGKLEKVLTPKLTGKILDFNKIIVTSEGIIASTTLGLYRLNSAGEIISSYHSRYGFSAEHVIDFIVDSNLIWVSHAKGVQQIEIQKEIQYSALILQLDQIWVNDQLFSNPSERSLGSDQRKIAFKLKLPTLRNQEITQYHYQLAGYSDEWHINSYHDNWITYNALAPGDYTFTVKPEIEGVFGAPVVYQFSIDHPVYMRWWFMLFVGLLIVGIVVIFYRRQLKIQKRKSDQLNELNSSKLTAIQSQMNPHFIFNSLNSIQDLVLKGDVENSYTYITTFSDLVRRTLNYSDKDLIEFEQEVKLLEVYLSLEKLRFKKDFDYQLITNDIEDINIPPLLVQPFVENALLHGLLHLEGHKELKVEFQLSEEALICTIQDNGVGRERAKEIRKRQRADHESFSGKAIKRRFEILSQVYEGDFDVVYEDLVSNGEAIGTKVILRMPYKQKF